MALLPEAVYDSDQVCVNDIKGNRKPKSFVPYSVNRLFKINKDVIEVLLMLEVLSHIILRLKICSVKLRMRRAMKPSCFSSVIVPEALACLRCDYYNRGHLNKVDQSDYRKITIHFRRKLSIIIEINNITCIEINQLQPTDGTFWAQWRKCMSPERLGLMKQAKNVSVS